MGKADLHRDAADILWAAAMRVQNKGWQQGQTYNLKTGATDLSGAIAIAAGVRCKALSSDVDPLRLVPLGRQAAVDIALCELEIHTGSEVHAWNDKSGRRAGEVVYVLKEAAASLELRADIMRAWWR